MDSMTKPGVNIHKEILVRLQVKDLIRCKSVCKSWNSLISSSRFIKSHLNYNLKKKVDNNETGDTRIMGLGASSPSDDDHCFHNTRYVCQVVGSSNGLVCVSRYNDFLVVNPSTREVKDVKNPPQNYEQGWSTNVSGFGYDSSIDDYKIVIGALNKYKDTYYVFKVLTLKSNVWRSVAVKLSYEGMMGGDGILCNGAIHWRWYHKNKLEIVSFDLSCEDFKEIPLPKLLDQDVTLWNLGTMQDRLCIFSLPDINNIRKNKEIEIWVMRNYNVQDSWERKLPPPGYETHKTMMCYFPQEDFLNRHVHIWLLEEGSCAPVLVRSIERARELNRFNIIENAHIRLSTISECNYNYNRHVFVKSLVSPHGMGDGDGDRGDGNINDVISSSTLVT